MKELIVFFLLSSLFGVAQHTNHNPYNNPYKFQYNTLTLANPYYSLSLLLYTYTYYLLGFFGGQLRN